LLATVLILAGVALWLRSGRYDVLATSRSRQAALSVAWPETPPLGSPIEIPVVVSSNDKHWSLYPALGDLDGDGRVDLLIGRSKGRMQWYRNVGGGARPQYAAPVWFDDICPNGRIPIG
jgi:hypothetical protein